MISFGQFAENVAEYIENEYYDLGSGKLSVEQKDTIFSIMRFEYDHGSCSANTASGLIVEYLKETSDGIKESNKS
jgi:hypothetical protein